MAVQTLANPSSINEGRPTYPDAALAYTPTNDIDTLSQAAIVVLAGSGGNITVRPANGGAAVTYTGMPPGYVIPHRVIGVNSTGLTATGLVLIY